MKKLTRIAAAGLALTMLIPMFTGCKKRGNGDTISADDPWFNMTSVVIGADIDYSQYSYGSYQFAGTYEDKFVYRFSGELPMPSDFDYERDDYNQYRVEKIELVDINGDILTSINLMDVFNNFERDRMPYISGVFKGSQGYYVDLVYYNYDTNEQIKYRAYIDFESGTIGTPEQLPPEDYVAALTAEGASEESSVRIGEYTIRKFWINDEQGGVTSYVLEAVDESGNANEFDLRTIFPSANVWDIHTIIDIGDNRALVCAMSDYGEDGNNLYFVIDFNTMTLTQDHSDMNWLSEDYYNISSVEGLGSVVKNADGIYKINYDNRSLDPVFLFNNSNANMYEVGNFNPVLVTEDRVILTGYAYTPMTDTNTNADAKICVFERADSNPNVGKTVIDAASVSSYSYAICNAVCEFNESNPDYFIRLNSDYSVGYTPDEVQSENTAMELGNQLAIDIMSGTGPDLIINGQQFGMLNDDDYLIDLRSFVDENFTSDKYFTNVFDAASEDDGKLYQVPLSFSISGIVTDSSNAEPGQVGFTFEQYGEFVSGPCNGTDPIGKGRLDFFINSLNCMWDQFITDGTVTCDTEAFRALADFANTSVNDVLEDSEDEGTTSEISSQVVSIANIVSYFNAVGDGRHTLLGIPTYDGRGPIMQGSDAVAISAQSDSVEGCKVFVTSLLGDSSQEIFALQAGIPVNRTAFESAGSTYIRRQNENIRRLLANESEAWLRENGINTDLMDESSIDQLVSVIEDLTGWYTNDGSINSIIREEMPAFFEGQKTLDQIIPVMEDRIQTILNERG